MADKLQFDPDLVSRREFETYLIQKAWNDEAFRQALLKNPQATFERELKALDPNGTIEPGLTINVIEETAAGITMVLPMKPDPDLLSESDLDAVAGGGCGSKECGCKSKQTECGSKNTCVRIVVDIPIFGPKGGGGGDTGDLPQLPDISGPTKIM